jgi:large subunit ribosomal protein L32
MAVPKKKTSKSKSRMRKGSNGTFKPDFQNAIIDKKTGELRLYHHISPDGTYRGRQIIVKKEKKAAKPESQE